MAERAPAKKARIDPKKKGKSRKLVFSIAGAVLGLLVLGVVAGVMRWQRPEPAEQAALLERQGDLQAAELEWRNAIAKAPSSAVLHLRRAQALLKLYDTIAAEKEFRTARRLGADLPTIMPSVWDIYVAQSRWKDLLRVIPGFEPPPRVTVKNQMYRGIAQLAMDDVPEARKSLQTMQDEAPKAAETHLLGARIAFAADHDRAAAEAETDQALKADPTSVDGLLLKLQLLAGRGDLAGAVPYADRAVAAAPWSPVTRSNRANLLMVSGRDTEAVVDVDAVLNRFPHFPAALYLKAMLLARASRYADASIALDRVMPFIDEYPRALYVSSLVEAGLGRIEVALELAKRYAVRAPGDADGARLVARMQIAARRPDLAVLALDKAGVGGPGELQTLDLLGTAYLALGNTASAMRVRTRAAQLAPDNPIVLTDLGLTELWDGQNSRAMATLERSIGLVPSQQDASEALVVSTMNTGDTEGAQSMLDRLRASAGETVSVGILCTNLMLARNNVEGARAAAAATLNRFPTSSPAKVNLANTLVLLGRVTEATNVLNEVLAADPADMVALTTMVSLLLKNNQMPAAVLAAEAAVAAAPREALPAAMLADLYIRAKQPQRAIAMLQKRADAKNLPPMLLGAMARSQAAAGLTEEALATYAVALKAFPGDLEARHGQVALLLRSNRVREAKASLQDGLAQWPGAIGIMSALTALADRMDGLEGALAMAAELRAQPSNMPAAALLRGDVFMVWKQYPEAVQAFRAELGHSASFALVQRLVGAYTAAGQVAEATQALRDWLTDHPNDAVAAQALAEMDLKSGDWDDAERNLDIVLARRPNDAVTLNNLAMVYQMKKDGRARATAQRAYLLRPMPQTADTLGWIMVQAGDAKGALSLLRPAGRDPAYPPMEYHRAVALRDTGQGDQAVETLRRLLASAAPFEGRDEASNLLKQMTP